MDDWMTEEHKNAALEGLLTNPVVVERMRQQGHDPCPERWPSTVHDGPHACVLVRGHGGAHRCPCSKPETTMSNIAAELRDIIALIREDREQPGLDPLQTLAAVESRLVTLAVTVEP